MSGLYQQPPSSGVAGLNIGEKEAVCPTRLLGCRLHLLPTERKLIPRSGASLHGTSFCEKQQSKARTCFPAGPIRRLVFLRLAYFASFLC